MRLPLVVGRDESFTEEVGSELNLYRVERVWRGKGRRSVQAEPRAGVRAQLRNS